MTNVRILLVEKALNLNLGGSGTVTLQNIDKKQASLRLSLGKEAKLLVQGNGLILDRQFLIGGRWRVLPDAGETLRLNGLRYRGWLELTAASDRIQAVNIVGVEDYLRGVVPNEVKPTWPLEALKAQAVSARTFTYYRMAAQVQGEYDLSAGPNSQVYKGVDSERPSTDQAVAETRDLVATIQGRYLSAFYHANCGGHTADVSQVWGGNVSYLTGVVCGYCDEGPHHAWTLDLSLEDLSRALDQHNQPGGPVRSVRALGRFPDGRVTEVEIKRVGTTDTVKAPAFRMMVGPDRLRSTNFKVSTQGSSLRFEGLGWGHGVGLCQEGAYGMARSGRGFADILKHYYPGCVVQRLER